MEHKHSLVIHRDEAGHAQIFVLDYEDGNQVGDTRELPADYSGHAAILTAIDAEYQPAQKAEPLDAAALAVHIAIRLGWNREADGGSSFDAAVTAIKHEIEKALAGSPEPLEAIIRASNEIPRSFDNPQDVAPILSDDPVPEHIEGHLVIAPLSNGGYVATPISHFTEPEKVEAAVPAKMGHRADVPCDAFLCLPKQNPSHYAPVRASDEAPESGSVATEDVLDTQPLTASE